mmetsp:Transcript_125001/g.216042  ORF Transcript_125001/g.216042 Transcript_125001/m.216042 type:complete len:223 (-) Transcript_125001:11-679(-)
MGQGCSQKDECCVCSRDCVPRENELKQIQEDPRDEPPPTTHPLSRQLQTNDDVAFMAATEKPANSRMPGYFDREVEELKLLDPAPHNTAPGERLTYRFRSGAVYNGQWRGGKRSGFGVQKWPDGAIYEGEWEENKAEGCGRFAHSDGDSYIGQWRSNVAHGQGVYYHRDLTTYEGEWCNDLQEGYGVESWGEGSRYEGLFKAGQKEGYGIYFWPDGSDYRGS